MKKSKRETQAKIFRYFITTISEQIYSTLIVKNIKYNVNENKILKEKQGRNKFEKKIQRP